MRRKLVPRRPLETIALPADHAAFVRGRVACFLAEGAGRYTLEHLLCEAYIQGTQDVVELMNSRGLYFPDPEISVDA
mgnify:CR=1 FL=1